MASWYSRFRRPCLRSVLVLQQGALVQKANWLEFTRDTEFTSPSAAAAVVNGGNANGLIAWKTEDGKTIKELEAE